MKPNEASTVHTVRKRLWGETVTVARFGLVGIIATGVHVLVVSLLLAKTLAPTLVANTFAFITAFGISFTGNYLWTFQSPGDPIKAMRRFLLISISAFSVNTFILAAILRTGWFPPIYAAIVSAAVIPMFTFLASRLWGFSYGNITIGPQSIIPPSDMIFVSGNHMRQPSSNGYEIIDKILPFIIGATVFFLVVGPRVLNPTNVAWLEQGDPSTHYLGWVFFRNAEWSFPIGLNPTYGLEFSNAILFSDSNPLFAFLFKTVAPILPGTFQYFGIWLLTCFVLQGWFGWKLVSLISDSISIRALGAGFFVFAPAMLWRLHGHLSLVGHFLIIAALYFALHQGVSRRKLAWVTLLAVAALVHAYLLAMVALVWLVDLAEKTIRNNLPAKNPTLEFTTIILVVGFACWQAGYFSVGDGVSSGGYGVYRMNLLSMFDASGWSYILQDIPEAVGDYEGFNFLGLGIIFLLVSALPAVFAGGAGASEAIGKHPILGMVLVGLGIFSASNKLGLGILEFEYPLPDPVLAASNIFRASGRMFWPVYYAIFFAVITLIVRGYEKRTSLLLLGLALAIQIADTSAAWTGFRKILMAEPRSTWKTSLTDPLWEAAASRYSKVRCIYPANESTGWKTLAAYASTHGLATDAVYLARVGTSALKMAQSKAFETLKTGLYETDSLYILDDRVLSQVAMNLNTDSDLLQRIDGLNVLAPGWKKCVDCPRSVDQDNSTAPLPPLIIGERMLVNESGKGLVYLGEGWSIAETWGTWSDGAKATIVFPPSAERLTSILIEANPLLSDTHPKQDIEVFVNGYFVTKLTLTTESKREFEVQLPKGIPDRTGNNKLLKMEFRFPDAAQPKDIGINDDTRRLAIGLVALTVRR